MVSITDLLSISSAKKSKYPRLYVDLIYEASGKYPAWDPQKQVALGDYGIINSSTGAFITKGNIFSETIAPSDLIRHCPQEDESCFTSVSARTLSFEPEFGGSLTGFAECSFKKKWAMGERPSASLSIIKWNLSYIEETTQFISTIRKSEAAPFIIVTEIVTCPAFSYFVHNEAKTELSLGFKASVPMQPVSPTAGISGEWISEGTVSVLRKCAFDGSSTDGSTFVPLYTLKAFRPRHAAISRLRASPLRLEDGEGQDRPGLALETEDDLDELLVPVAPPWDILDSEGDEEI